MHRSTLLVGLPSFMTSQLLVAQQPGAITRPDSSPPARTAIEATVVVPLVSDPQSRVVLPVVEVTVNGRGSYRFGIETGARFLGLSPAPPRPRCCHGAPAGSMACSVCRCIRTCFSPSTTRTPVWS